MNGGSYEQLRHFRFVSFVFKVTFKLKTQRSYSKIGEFEVLLATKSLHCILQRLKSLRFCCCCCCCCNEMKIGIHTSTYVSHAIKDLMRLLLKAIDRP